MTPFCFLCVAHLMGPSLTAITSETPGAAMLESVVERLLSRYLAPYVLGISKDKLSVAVWSGNVELTELHVKPEVSDLLGMPFKVLWGRIGKITLNIPWSSLGSSPVCVDIQDVYLLLEPRPIPQQSDTELQQQLRQVKLQKIDACELQIQEVRQQMQQQLQQQAGKDADGGFFFRLANKILSTLQVNVQGIHVALIDGERGFKAGVLLERMSLHNTDESWRRREGFSSYQQQQNFYKACELNGLAAYCKLDAKQEAFARRWETADASLREESEVEAELYFEDPSSDQEKDGVPPPPPTEPHSKSREQQVSLSEMELAVSTELHDEDLLEPSKTPPAQQPPAKQRLKAGATGTSPGAPGHLFERSSAASSGRWSRPERHAHTSSEATQAGFKKPARGACTWGRGRCRYILKPLHVRLTLAHASAEQTFSARLEVLRESHGIAIGKAQLSAFLQLMHEAEARRKRCERVLLREACTVCLVPEALEGGGQTQGEFVALYGRQLQTEAGIIGVEPLTDEEEKRLRVLYDVVGVRHVSA
ncbi:vacuolar protein sorting-associated protein 13c isoform related protein [Cyclospora cayetanensis]|uniref:Vacuolar protein sorting-associated protein 13c isoform related protein n=1 Tax=Cyclospora cayetanensis TaxID=88456 RepID=A0A1D3CT57_9EIME|nr:vacuolar protein sorting-associated protein 13c isoform related protein [Cyclospora cayetanensis]